MIRPRRKHLLLAFALAFVSEPSSASCSDLATAWLGVGLGPIRNYPEGLPPGIAREGSARVIEGVGFESLEGAAHGLRFHRIILFADRGSFIGFTAALVIEGAENGGYSEVVRRVAAATGASIPGAKQTAVFSCGSGIALRVETGEWDDKGRSVLVRLTDEPAETRMRQYIEEYCADPARRKPTDACR